MLILEKRYLLFQQRDEIALIWEGRHREVLEVVQKILDRRVA